MIAKLGPFCSRDNCSLVRVVLDRLISHLLVLKSLIRLLGLMSAYMRNKIWYC